MNEKALYKLEFHKVKEQLKQFVRTEMGEQAIDELHPSSEYNHVLRLQKETADALNMSIKKGKMPINKIKEIKPSIKRIEIGAILSCSEVLNIGNLLKTIRLARRYYKEDEKEEIYTYLKGYFDDLLPNVAIENRINQCIVAVDEYSDEATPELSSIRRQIKSTNNKIRETMQRILQTSKYQDMLQEPVITIRQDRYCVPVKAEYKNAFGGIVHDQSSTGATVFMEPGSVVDLNNNLRLLFVKEQEEIEKILIELTELIAGIIPELNVGFRAICDLDVIFAKSEYALKINAREPRLNTKGYVDLKRARHPLLKPEEVVPIDVYLGDQFTTLLVTGPNTGGKTVTIKTVGLFTMMAQAGLQIPAGEGSSIAVFDDVFAELGDEQSIEQSLSTFSAHMTQIISILEKMTTNSLVILDEIGSGTDPVEGAALAKSILEHLRKQQIRTVATTHYSELKLYALSTEGVENASCEFDVEKLSPTYRLMIGVPGKSNAFAISKKLGLPEHLIDDAKVYIQKEDIKMEDILVELEYSKKIAETEKEKAQKLRQETQELQQKIKEQKDKLEQSKRKILDKANERANEILKKVEEEAEKVLKDVRQAAKKAKVNVDEKTLYQAKQGMTEALKEQKNIIGKTIGPKTTYKKLPKDVKKGEEVMVTTLMQQGTIVEVPDESGNALVRVGILPIKVHISNLQRTEQPKQPTSSSKKQKAIKNNSAQIKRTSQIKVEVDVRGMMVDEALPVVDKYLDDAYLAGLAQATIIHGKGTGALRKAITQMLKSHPHIKSHRPGKYGEGEHGVTVVEFKG